MARCGVGAASWPPITWPPSMRPSGLPRRRRATGRWRRGADPHEKGRRPEAPPSLSGLVRGEAPALKDLYGVGTVAASGWAESGLVSAGAGLTGSGAAVTGGTTMEVG